MAVGDAHVFPGFLTPVLTQLFFPKPPLLFSQKVMLLQSREVKIRRKEKMPQLGIELTTTRLWVPHAHHWATQAGQISRIDGFERYLGKRRNVGNKELFFFPQSFTSISLQRNLLLCYLLVHSTLLFNYPQLLSAWKVLNKNVNMILVASIFSFSHNDFKRALTSRSLDKPFQHNLNFKPFLHRYSFWCINTRQLLKTLWKKEKLIVMSNFSFFPSVFYSIRWLYPHLSIFFTS